MASHIIGPLIVTDRVLQDDERAVLYADDGWTIDTLESEPLRTPVLVAWTDNHIRVTWSET